MLRLVLANFGGEEGGARCIADVLKKERTNGNGLYNDSATVRHSVKVGYTLCSWCTHKQLDCKLARRGEVKVGG